MLATLLACLKSPKMSLKRLHLRKRDTELLLVARVSMSKKILFQNDEFNNAARILSTQWLELSSL